MSPKYKMQRKTINVEVRTCRFPQLYANITNSHTSISLKSKIKIRSYHILKVFEKLHFNVTNSKLILHNFKRRN